MEIVLSREGEKARREVVLTVEEASQRLRRWVEINGLGASDLKSGCGTIWEGRLVVARVSYNGQIWRPDGTPWVRS